MFSFEFNEEKSQSNLEKHGIDFIQAQNSGTIHASLKFREKLLMNPGL